MNTDERALLADDAEQELIAIINNAANRYSMIVVKEYNRGLLTDTEFTERIRNIEHDRYAHTQRVREAAVFATR